jgi:ribosomal protein L37AE/L43A
MDQEDGLDNAEVPEQHSRQHSSNNSFSFNPDATSFQPSFDTTSHQAPRGERQQQSYQNDDNRNKNKNQAPSFVHGRYNQSSTTESVQLFNNLERRRNNGQRQTQFETRRGVKDRQHFGRNSSKKSNSAETAETSTSSNSSEVDSSSSSLTRVPGGGVDGRKKTPDIRNQRERLSDQLNRNACECMICVERVDRSNRIWSCSKCFNIFHLHCVSTWANSSKDGKKYYLFPIRIVC